mmetsp:Transcript_11438/g.37834  ORF Transcript_11438/g.37834 Transcript_11438/m.37834 type:complete len:97 (-) Transcript_11438:1892-2182(-)
MSWLENDKLSGLGEKAAMTCLLMTVYSIDVTPESIQAFLVTRPSHQLLCTVPNVTSTAQSPAPVRTPRRARDDLIRSADEAQNKNASSEKTKSAEF